MTTEIIAVTDLPAELQAKDTVELMVAGANGQAERVAPCLFAADPAPSAGQLSEAKLLLLGAVVRWSQQGASGTIQQGAGPFTLGVQTNSSGYRLWPSEIVQLQEICSGGTTPGPGSIDTAPGIDYGHLPWCDWNFNDRTSCSCGYDIAARPIYENMPGL
jgi:hypothetical protein